MALKDIDWRKWPCADLHTHLLGTGDSAFWMKMLFSRDELNKYYGENARCIFVWDAENGKYMPFSQVYTDLCRAFTEKKIPSWAAAVETASSKEDESYPRSLLLNGNLETDLTPAKWSAILQAAFPDVPLNQILDLDGPYFTSDVVIELDDLIRGLGLDMSDPLAAQRVRDRLKLIDTDFDHYLFWNARKQSLEIGFGILRERLIQHRDSLPNGHRESFDAHLQNCFTMLNMDGSEAKSVDFHGFHMSFTPQFYPRRYALKDSLYRQRIDVLAHVLNFSRTRYFNCSPKVTYIEYSLGANDCASPHILDLFAAFNKDTCDESSFHKQFVAPGASSDPRPLLGQLEDPKGELPTFCLLAGISRKIDHSAATWIWHAPWKAIRAFEQEISQLEEQHGTSMFAKQNDTILRLDKVAASNQLFKTLVVGVDIFGDELGFPFCPLVTKTFEDFWKARLEDNKAFGVRIHGAENVPVCGPHVASYRCFAAHMFIVFRGLQALLQMQDRLNVVLDSHLRTSHLDFIRVGHGVQFRRTLTLQHPPEHRKSSLLITYIQQELPKLAHRLVFEVNITSNEYLLEDDEEPAFGWFMRNGYLIVLATDNDGIWPINTCLKHHPEHHSLTAEFCNAFSTFPSAAKFNSYKQVFVPNQAEATKYPRQDFHQSNVHWHLMLAALGSQCFAFQDNDAHVKMRHLLRALRPKQAKVSVLHSIIRGSKNNAIYKEQSIPSESASRFLLWLTGQDNSSPDEFLAILKAKFLDTPKNDTRLHLCPYQPQNDYGVESAEHSTQLPSRLAGVWQQNWRPSSPSENPVKEYERATKERSDPIFESSQCTQDGKEFGLHFIAIGTYGTEKQLIDGLKASVNKYDNSKPSYNILRSNLYVDVEQDKTSIPNLREITKGIQSVVLNKSLEEWSITIFWHDFHNVRQLHFVEPVNCSGEHSSIARITIRLERSCDVTRRSALNESSQEKPIAYLFCDHGHTFQAYLRFVYDQKKARLTPRAVECPDETGDEDYAPDDDEDDERDEQSHKRSKTQ
eukprot:m.13643 g.13643  ORF g.13643 m.13643 type:complete len:1027 (+) comp7348_c0_seq2:189-3269(+)